MEIDKDTSLEKILNSSEAAKVLAKHKVPSIGCPMARVEMDKLTLGQVWEAYGLDFEKIREDLQNLEEE